MRPKRRLGQNFLTGAGYSERIVEAVAPRPDEPILEIGPGQGALTALLLEQQAVVTAIELDHELIPLLESRFGSNARFRLIEDDALKVDFCHLFADGQRVRVVANLPYIAHDELWMCSPELALMSSNHAPSRLLSFDVSLHLKAVGTRDAQRVGNENDDIIMSHSLRMPAGALACNCVVCSHRGCS